MKRGMVMALLLVIAGGVAYYALSPLWRNIEINEASPLANTADGSTLGEMSLISQGAFVPKAHDVAGKALLIDDEGQMILRFEDFETINGPDVNIYLSKDLEAKDYVDLGDIKATKGNVNYTVPADTDINKYNKVLVWCQDFSVLFSYAILEPR